MSTAVRRRLAWLLLGFLVSCADPDSSAPWSFDIGSPPAPVDGAGDPGDVSPDVGWGSCLVAEACCALGPAGAEGCVGEDLNDGGWGPDLDGETRASAEMRAAPRSTARADVQRVVGGQARPARQLDRRIEQLAVADEVDREVDHGGADLVALLRGERGGAILLQQDLAYLREDQEGG